MAKKITVTLSAEAEQYLAEVQYGLVKENDKPANQSDCINESLETLQMFEAVTDNQLRNWLQDYNKLSEEAKRFVSNPTQENYYWFFARKAIKEKS